jgi:hypothetical protein
MLLWNLQCNTFVSLNEKQRMVPKGKKACVPNKKTTDETKQNGIFERRSEVIRPANHS